MTRYRFDQIAENSTAKKKPEESDRNRYVGLEHLDPGTLEVTRWGAEVTPKGDKLLMKKGDVLFGRRRAYQKKVGIAPFDGIFSAHGMVLRPKADVVDPMFFPFFISSDIFLDEAIRVSVGSLSPTANWKDLRTLEFDLPSPGKQRELAGILSEAECLKGHYRNLLAACDDVVKSQFVEMFGDALTGYKYRLQSLGSMLSTEPQNGLYKPQSFYVEKGGSPIVRVDAFQKGCIEDYSALKRLTCTSAELETYELVNNDIVINRVNGSIDRVGKIAWIRGLREPTVFESNMMRFHIDEKRMDLAFVATYLNSDDIRQQIKACARIANQCSINQTNVANFVIPAPPLDLQREFADFVAQVDKSKFKLGICGGMLLRCAGRPLRTLMWCLFFYGQGAPGLVRWAFLCRLPL